MQTRLFRRTLSLCLLASAVGACWTIASTKDDKPPFAVPAPLVPLPPPEEFMSRWDEANWKARRAVLSKAGLVEVGLGSFPAKESFKAPKGSCQLVDSDAVDRPGQWRLLYSSGAHAVSADGVLHCLDVELTSLGEKTVRVEGHPRDCGGGAFRHYTPTLYVVPAGIQVGDTRKLRLPVYSINYRYEQRCQPVP